ncbi:hypothetical protein C5E45_11060 [Nocardia nova]|uniref:TPR repeat domain-containing protein n=1 Tax=Nocardia nova TaxID=37330 RepID=A0A2S6ASV8_9NOCA|nr:hypothetical protein [Nocardia nova]PPJ30139.1 hypothetical protein C5E41_09475 [Nocardia nova]PPJ38273.1 hypothetical protein C5E45_11060 [Nocardia nova]
MPLRSELERWNLQALKDWASTVHAGNEKLLEKIDKARKYFNDVGYNWTGMAFYAAYDRVGQDHDEARKVYADIADFLDKFGPAVDSVSSHRDVLRAKAADAEQAAVTVADNWSCSGTKHEDVQAHQDAIDTAYRELTQAEAELGRLLTDRSELIRAAGDLFGSSIEVDEAPTAGSRLGGEDGKRLADAARTHDTAAIDAVAADMPPFHLTPQDLQDLADGKQVSDIPADVQDYYRSFFQASGKDGLFALSDRLAEGEAMAHIGGGATNPAAVQRDNLANAIMMMSNENVGSTGPDGKFRGGGIGELPSYMQHLVSDRLESNPPKTALEMKTRFADQAKFAQLLGEANPGFTPGKGMAGQMATTAASMAGYLDGKTPHVGDMVDGFKHEGPFGIGDKYFDEDKPKIEAAAKSYLDLATRNHDVDYNLLTNPDATAIAENDYYADPKTCRNEIFAHDWGDKGKVASQLYSWAGEHAHDRTPDGDLSRKTLAALPEVFSPTQVDEHGNHTSKLVTGAGDHTEFQNNADLFKKNPELATGLSKVLAPNLDALADPHQGETKTWPFPDASNSTYPHPPVDDVRLGRDDGDRLLFLANQSEDGRNLLETSRALRESAIYDQAMKEGGDNVGEWLADNEDYSHLQSLNDRMTVQHYNALFYGDNMDAEHTAQHLQEVYESKQKAADVAKSVIDTAVPFDKFTKPVTAVLPQVLADPAGKYINGLPDKWMDSAISSWNHKPDPVHVQDPNPSQVSSEINRETSNRLLDAAYRNGQLPTKLLNPDGTGPIHLTDDTAHATEAQVTEFIHIRGLRNYVTESQQSGDIAILMGLKDDREKLQSFLSSGYETVEPTK